MLIVLINKVFRTLLGLSLLVAYKCVRYVIENVKNHSKLMQIIFINAILIG